MRKQAPSSIVNTPTVFGISGILDGLPTSVWVEDRKVAAIGVKVGRKVTTHGLELDASTDHLCFQYFVPCGMPFAGVTSVSHGLGGLCA